MYLITIILFGLTFLMMILMGFYSVCFFSESDVCEHEQ